MFNPNKTPQDRLHVWIVSVCGDGTCALKLYQDLLWTVWYSQRECGLNFSSVALHREQVHKPRTRNVSVIEYWAAMNTHSYTHVWALEAWRIGQRLIRTLSKWRIELIKMGQKDGFFLELSAVIRTSSTIAFVVAATVLPVCSLPGIQYISLSQYNWAKCFCPTIWVLPRETIF